MMDLSSVLDVAIPIVVKLTSQTREDAIEELANIVFTNFQQQLRFDIGVEDISEAVLNRERAHSTGIGDGLAFPHARIEGWGEMAVIVGISQHGIDFASIDDKPVKMIFMMISSTDEAYAVLQAMSAILKTIKKHVNFEQLMREHIDVHEVGNIFRHVKVDSSAWILVQHIACPVRSFVTMDTSIEELTRLIHAEHVDVVPVVDNNGKFCGEVSCLDVFQFGMPDFFKQLNTISFVKHIDPFDKFFQLKKTLTVKDIFKKEVRPLTKENTLMEVIFEMTVNKKSRLFVVDDDNRLIGMIDRMGIIDKILFL